MSNQTNKVIKDMNNKVVGTIRTHGNVTRLTDVNNRTVGTYNNKTNVTYNGGNGGKAIGQGDQLIKIRL